MNKLLKMDLRKILLISSSNVHGYEYLQYAANDIQDFLKRNGVKSIVFIPYALTNHEEYATKVSKCFQQWGLNVDSVHTRNDPQSLVKNAEAFFIGGGNTFLLLQTLYEKDILNLIHDRVVKNGVPYIGASAGTNVATTSINTTNDMPIVYPPSFKALNLVPFNINPHYLDPVTDDKHKGETREERILQYLKFSDNPVLAMREGCHLLIENGQAKLQGFTGARLFLKNKPAQELSSGSDVSFLL